MHPRYKQERKLATEGFPQFLKNGMFMGRYDHLDEVTLRNIEIRVEEICMEHHLKMEPVKFKDLYDPKEGKIVFRADMFKDPAHCDIFWSIIRYESFANFIVMTFDEPVTRKIFKVEVK